MKTSFLRKFLKDIDDLPDQPTRERLAVLIEAIEAAADLSQIQNLKKLSGHRNAYRIRMGDYRIGLFIEGDAVEFARVVHRKTIYDVFP